MKCQFKNTEKTKKRIKSDGNLLGKKTLISKNGKFYNERERTKS